MNLRILIVTIVVLVCASCQTGGSRDEGDHETPMLQSLGKKSKAAVTWKAVLLTGDDEINAFDNSRKELASVLAEIGFAAANVRQLSMAKAEQNGKVKPASLENLDVAFSSLKIKDGDGCLLHMTSHGTPEGLYLRGQTPLSPGALHQVLTRYCGKRPTIILVSACYSGVFQSKTLKAKNRVILTAARDDRTSFGCGVDDVYTFWDGCLLSHLRDAPANWQGLAKSMRQCIEKKENDAKVDYRSYPQSYVGQGMKSHFPFGKGKGDKPKTASPKKRRRGAGV